MPSAVRLGVDHDAAELRMLPKRSRDPRQIRRLETAALRRPGPSGRTAAPIVVRGPGQRPFHRRNPQSKVRL